LRKRKVGAGEDVNTYYDILDGQQRINTFVGFVQDKAIKEGPDGKQESSFKPLFDPTSGKDKKRFPLSLHGKSVPWAGKIFSTLSDELRAQFLDTKVPVAEIVDCTDDEARHLFIRLQGGRPITRQHVRDSWPSKFGDLVVRFGGKISAGQKGHDFFRKLTKFSVNNPQVRQLAAQVLMLYLKQREQGSTDFFVTIDSGALDDFYIEKVGIDHNSDEIDRFEKILDKLVAAFGNSPPAFQAHTVIHLVLFTSMLMDEYVAFPDLGKVLASAQKKFLLILDKTKEFKTFPKDAERDVQEIWDYHAATVNKSDSSRKIKTRHEIYVKLMTRYMGDKLKPLDSKRLYSPDEREQIYRRDGAQCYVCEGEVSWNDAEIHHVEEHHKGGQTTLDNGVLVHAKCHPRGRPRKAA